MVGAVAASVVVVSTVVLSAVGVGLMVVIVIMHEKRYTITMIGWCAIQLLAGIRYVFGHAVNDMASWEEHLSVLEVGIQGAQASFVYVTTSLMGLHCRHHM